MTESTNWRTYEDVARYLLDKIADLLGLERVEGKQYVPGKKSGTKWEIDAKGVCNNGTAFIVVEIRRYTTSRLSQEALASLAYRIDDTGASGGIVVSPLPLQSGAQKVADSGGIVAVQLDENSTTEQYVLRFLKTVMVGLKPEGIMPSISILGMTLTTVESPQSGNQGDT